MGKNGIEELANAYNELYWSNFYKCFPNAETNKEALSEIPKDVLSVLNGLLGEEQVEQWINYEFEEFDGMKPIELVKTKDGLKALKMFILSMPN